MCKTSRSSTQPSAWSHGFSIRAVLGGMLLGCLMSIANTYFGLQTGWVTMASIQCAILGFFLFKAPLPVACCRRAWGPFTIAENVILQTIAVAASTMPLAAGFVGIVPALKMIDPAELGGEGRLQTFNFGQQLLWCTALAFFGCFFAIPLRKRAIVKEKLRFPSGFATAAVVAALHGFTDTDSASRAVRGQLREEQGASAGGATLRRRKNAGGGADAGAVGAAAVSLEEQEEGSPDCLDTLTGSSRGPASAAAEEQKQARMALLSQEGQEAERGDDDDSTGKAKAGGMSAAAASISPAASSSSESGLLRDIGFAFLASGGYSLLSYFLPVVAALPLFSWVSLPGVTGWGWYLTLSPSYIGQGAIMGFRTTFSILLGAIAGWGIIGPIALSAGWVAGSPMSWPLGGKGMLQWISLAVLLAEAVLVMAQVMLTLPCCASCMRRMGRAVCSGCVGEGDGAAAGSTASSTAGEELAAQAEEEEQDPLPGVPNLLGVPGLLLATALCTAILAVMLGLPWFEPLLAVLLSMPISAVAVRALGQTDLNPVSAVGKISQAFFFALGIPSVYSNLIAGAVAEAGAQQAGDMLQDLKTGYLLGISPQAQFLSQLLGSVAGIFSSSAAYTLFSSSFGIPSPSLPVPSAGVWVSMARLLSGGSLSDALPPAVLAIAGASLFLTLMCGALRMRFELLEEQQKQQQQAGQEEHVLLVQGSRLDRIALRAGPWIPSPVAFAIGLYVAPNWSIPRLLGSMLAAAWVKRMAAVDAKKRERMQGPQRFPSLPAAGGSSTASAAASTAVTVSVPEAQQDNLGNNPFMEEEEGAAAARGICSSVGAAAGAAAMPSVAASPARLPPADTALQQAEHQRQQEEQAEADARQARENRVLMVATGLVLGEGMLSLVLAGLASGNVKPWSCGGCTPGACGSFCP